MAIVSCGVYAVQLYLIAVAVDSAANFSSLSLSLLLYGSVEERPYLDITAKILLFSKLSWCLHAQSLYG